VCLLKRSSVSVHSALTVSYCQQIKMDIMFPSTPPTAISSGVTMGWLLHLVTGGPTGGKGQPTVLEFLVINFKSEGGALT